MSGKSAKIVHLVIILAFLFVAGTIDLFHTDGMFGKDASCPACTFHSFAVASVPVELFQLPVFVSVEQVPFTAIYCSEQYFSLPEAARAPPLD